MKMDTLPVATTIFTQLGGHRFMLMTGSSDFVGDEDSLTMRLATNALKAMWCRVTLTPDDNYRMEFLGMRGGIPVVMKEYGVIYFDQLQDVFTDATGLATTL